MEFIKEELSNLKQKNLYRQLKTMNAAQSSRTMVNDKECILLSSNNYLGLTEHPELKAAAKEAVDLWGTGSGGSRLITGNMRLHEELEETIARFKGTEAAIVFNTGYMANMGAITALVGRGDIIFSDELNHASIIDGCRLSQAKTIIYPHKDTGVLEKLLQQNRSYRRIYIITDGVFSMDGDLAPLPRLVELAEKYNAWLMVDDAHATGVMGHRGSGTAEHFGLESRIPIQIGTLSKAIGSAGGFVAGSYDLIDYLRNKARSFIYSTALPPSEIAVALAAFRVLRTNPQIRESLHLNAHYLRSGLKKIGFTILTEESPVIPVLIGDASKAVQMAQQLLSLGVFAPGIRPPTVPPGMSRLRVAVMATHTRDDLDKALAAFSQAGKETGVM
ncbi:8-amino-7-oxononanoate synthase [Sporotomaculum syntrophicum]|uniref:8-amino-7-ketopelargonate synthase n=1 Tax=Sporotomaculum syntrophicum TaxID=182264 RepID=A0A9D2WQE6_9FIRM|nr:8-amino-7-oxononanoate synthase [Sporotomaculum syntrophicum]KAF1085448.1 8-amino-7-oxononanoate synthase [Sporotomaculum syntrophicum]